MAPDPLHAIQDISAKKKIYFIRHGESEGNVGPVRQTGLSGLTDSGRQQATVMAQRCAKLPIEIIISSTMVRAQETAAIIATTAGKNVEESELFVERRRPSVQRGKPKDDPDALAADQAIRDNFGTPGFRHSDEETFDEQKARALMALQFLASRPEKNIAVVTHGFFMRVVLAAVVFGGKLTGKECELFIRAFHMENTGLTVLGYDGADNKLPWWVWIWNDHAHLG